jgi:hypothetical protein
MFVDAHATVGRNPVITYWANPPLSGAPARPNTLISIPVLNITIPFVADARVFSTLVALLELLY